MLKGERENLGYLVWQKSGIRTLRSQKSDISLLHRVQLC